MNLTSTLLAQSAVFMIFVWICMRFIWPPLREAMRERQANIAAGLQAAEDADRRLAEAKSGAEDEEEQCGEAEFHGGRLLVDATRAECQLEFGGSQ